MPEKIRRKLPNSEYYTLLFAAVLLRVAFYMLTSVIDEQYIHETFTDFAHVEFEHLEYDETRRLEDTVDFINDVLYKYGIADFMLLGTMAALIICFRFRGRQRALRIISVTGTVLVVTLTMRLFVFYLYTVPGEFAYMAFLRMIEPLLVYIIPVCIITYFIFAPGMKNIVRFMKTALLKPTSIAFFIVGFALTGAYIYMVAWWENAYIELAASPFSTFEEAMELLRVREHIEVFLYVANTVFICGTVFCFYRSVRRINDG